MKLRKEFDEIVQSQSQRIRRRREGICHVFGYGVLRKNDLGLRDLDVNEEEKEEEEQGKEGGRR